MTRYLIYTDGASRGNPGPAGAGAVILSKEGKLLGEYSKFLGKMTNNQAEYEAAIFALSQFKLVFGKKKAKESKITLKTDSDLLAKQMRGEYKVKNEGIQPLFLALWNLCLDFGGVEFVQVERSKNQRADRLANEALDAELGQKPLIE